jgi:hypothetical protein
MKKLEYLLVLLLTVCCFTGCTGNVEEGAPVQAEITTEDNNSEETTDTEESVNSVEGFEEGSSTEEASTNSTNDMIYVSEVSDALAFRFVCSDPAAGQMVKELEFRISGSEEWYKIEDLTAVIPNYPVGLVFLDNQTGLIMTDYHGVRNFLYRTEDGGYTWTGMYLGEESDIYSNGVSIEYDRESGVLSAKTSAKISDDQFVDRTYTSEDFGVSWNQVD